MQKAAHNAGRLEFIQNISTLICQFFYQISEF